MAVVAAVARTAKVITAAALIMVAVFSAFVLSPEVFLKLIGVGLATAILIDATIVRMILVPAVMEILGEKDWWAARWLKRLIPEVDLKEGCPAPPLPDPNPKRHDDASARAHRSGGRRSSCRAGDSPGVVGAVLELVTMEQPRRGPERRPSTTFAVLAVFSHAPCPHDPFTLQSRAPRHCSRQRPRPRPPSPARTAR